MIKQKKNQRTYVSLLTVFCIIILICIPNYAQAKAAAKEKTPKELETDVSKVLKAIKNNDEKILNKYCADEDGFFIGEDGSDEFTDFLLENMKKMSYSVKSYEVKGKKAKVKVKFKYVDASDFSRNYVDLLYEKIFMDMLTGSSVEMSDEDYMNMAEQAIKISDCSSFKTETITLNFRKLGSKWKLSDYSDELTNIVYSNILVSMEDYMYEWIDSMYEEIENMDETEE